MTEDLQVGPIIDLSQITRLRDEIVGEEWRTIPGLEPYQASYLGRIKSLPRMVNSSYGKTRVIRERVLRPAVGNGYPQVAIYGKSYNVHQLVALTWLGPPPAGLEVCHWDGYPANCEVTNLYYGTRRQNHLDRHRHGSYQPPPNRWLLRKEA